MDTVEENAIRSWVRVQGRLRRSTESTDSRRGRRTVAFVGLSDHVIHTVLSYYVGHSMKEIMSVWSIFVPVVPKPYNAVRSATMMRPPEVYMLCRILEALARLTRLDVQNQAHITDDGVQCLSALSNLQQLNLYGYDRITDTGVQSLSVLSKLQQLNLEYCINITDAGVQSLSVLSNLQQLNLGGCGNITDAGVQSLSVLSNLQQLNLSGCYNITDAGVL